jgi:general secretion pathway protein G
MKRTIQILSLLVLATLAISIRMIAAKTAEEVVRREDSLTVTNAIHAYTLDTRTPPNSLDDLIDTGYLKAKPGDFPRFSDPVPQPLP